MKCLATADEKDEKRYAEACAIILPMQHVKRSDHRDMACDACLLADFSSVFCHRSTSQLVRIRHIVQRHAF